MNELPSPPFVFVEGIHNFRDIGGYPSTAGYIGVAQSIRRNFIFRSAEPSKITPAGAQKLRDLGITTIFDLRSGPEIKKLEEKMPLVEIDRVQRVWAPVPQDKDYSPEQIAIRYREYASKGTEGFTRAYKDILESGPLSFREVLLHLRDKPDEGCLIHCTAGKDRTGLITALILLLAGVSEKTIAEEYELTEIGLASWKPAIVNHLLQESVLKANQEGVKNMISAKAENMLAALEMMRASYDGAVGYLTQNCGLSLEDLYKIRRNLFVVD
ncbi:MAG: hypothetical protein M1812_003329 [Candelaria pacifica]|nr:MAG: hypothetical protein M1812_003329 [Candelaria pacifica]